MVDELATLGAGAVLAGRYRLDRRVGSGGTSTVWRAHDLTLDRPVAVKALLDGGVEEALAGRFEREASILARLDHPNVVPVLASGMDDGRPYLVMELIEGQPLSRVLGAGPLPLDDALALVADVAAGLAAAHRAGVVHRDVKPANIVCGSDGSPRLVDFGIARSSDLSTMTMPAAVLGTASYLAPEQARGETPTPATDVYALGCVLYACLTGRPPFEADGPLAVAYRHVHDQPVAPGARRDGIPPEVDAFVLRALAKEASARPSDAGVFERELRRLRRGEAVAPEAAASEVTVVVPAVDATLLLPAVGGAAEVVEPIDPAPLAPAAPRPPWHRRGRLVAAVAAAVFVLSLLVAGALSGDDARPAVADAPAPSSTSTTMAATTTAPVLAGEPSEGREAGPPATPGGKGKKAGKAKGGG